MQMNEINPVNKFEFGSQGLNPQPTNPLAQNLAQARVDEADSFQLMSSGSLSSKELTPLVKLLASRLQISELMAFKMVRKFMGTGQASSFSELQDFLLEFTKAPQNYQTANKQPVVKQLQELNRETDTQKLEKGFQNITKNLKDIFLQDKILKARAEGSRLLETSLRPEGLREAPIHLTKLVSQPKEFASWLVNNKAAFIALRAYPNVTNILAAMQNPQIQQSPVMMAQLVALLVQILQLKAGKSPTDDLDERVREERDLKASMEDAEHEANIVNTVKQTIESVPIAPIREFLIEAERFAEEEVANLWSLTLRKERELEKKMKEGLEKFRKKK